MQTARSEKEEKVVLMEELIFSCSLWRICAGTDGYSPRTAAHGRPTLEQRRSVGRKEQQGQTLAITPTHRPCAAQGGERSWE